MKTVTFFQEGVAPFSREYTDSAGDNIIMLIDADEHIKKGGFVLVDSGSAAQMIEFPIFGRRRAP